MYPDLHTPHAEPSVRPGRVAVAAALTELVVIAVLDNQAVTGWVNRTALPRDDLLTDVWVASQQYAFRFTTAAGDSGRSLGYDMGHSVGYGLVRDLVVLGVTALLVRVLADGAARFGRVLLATWTSVVVATLLGVMVASLFWPPVGPGSGARERLFSRAVLPHTAWAGLVLGLLTGLVAATVAMRSRLSILASRPTPVPTWLGYPVQVPEPWTPERRAAAAAPVDEQDESYGRHSAERLAQEPPPE